MGWARQEFARYPNLIYENYKFITAQDLRSFFFFFFTIPENKKLQKRPTLYIKYFRKNTSPNFQAQAVPNINFFKSNP